MSLSRMEAGAEQLQNRDLLKYDLFNATLAGYKL